MVAACAVRWQHPVASSEALDVLHWAVCHTLHHCICMVIKIASNLPAFLLSPIICLHTTIVKDHVMVNINQTQDIA